MHKRQAFRWKVTCALCWCEIRLLLRGPYLPGHSPLTREGSFLRLESTLRSLSLEEHRREDGTSKTPVRINGVFLHVRERQIRDGPSLATWKYSDLKSNGTISKYVL